MRSDDNNETTTIRIIWYLKAGATVASKLEKIDGNETKVIREVKDCQKRHLKFYRFVYGPQETAMEKIRSPNRSEHP